MEALNAFDEAKMGYACDIDGSYIEVLKNWLSDYDGGILARVETADFFSKDWESALDNLPEPILVIGNPPWVTNSQLGQLKSDNLPAKQNHKKMKGLDALTGKSNFDISEWMINRMIEWLQEKQGTVAMLCKTSVARKVLLNSWKRDKKMEVATMHLIDSKSYFQISAEACLLTITSSYEKHKECKVYNSIQADNPAQTIGLRDCFLVADIHGYEKTKHLIENGQHYKWRTGIKHDCSKVMELEKIGKDRYINGFGETSELEDLCLYPLLKGSGLANGKTPEKFMLVPQTKIGQETRYLAETAPKTLEYLIKYGDLLDRRVSSIYKGKPRFSVFGVGDYTFSSWKVAIPALYKQLEFFVVGPHEGKAVVFDDTVNFIAMDNAEESYRLAEQLNSNTANIFYRSFIFWDSKRPITVQLLRSLDIDRLLAESGSEFKYSISKTSRQLQLI
ncbi:MAG: SAM-dependent methyltransferase [Candidatus Dadabacteria bacterium]|nr:SAM-dependent methyltransferase [Candidatus Dadabacteria bacterium]